MTLETEYQPLLGEIKAMFIDGEIKNMVWNGEKWLVHADVFPLIYYAVNGRPLDLDGKKLP